MPLHRSKIGFYNKFIVLSMMLVLFCSPQTMCIRGALFRTGRSIISMKPPIWMSDSFLDGGISKNFRTSRPYHTALALQYLLPVPANQEITKQKYPSYNEDDRSRDAQKRNSLRPCNHPCKNDLNTTDDLNLDVGTSNNKKLEKQAVDFLTHLRYSPSYYYNYNN